MSAVLFPQPEVEAPENGAWCYYAGVTAIKINWGGADDAKAALAAGKIYAAQEDCQQRIAYDAQEMARLVIPAWFRALGPDVEVDASMPWANAPDWKKFVATDKQDWSQINPKRLRCKPAPDVVVNVNGVEYRWPATAKQGDPIGDRFTALLNCVEYSPASQKCGNRTHHTRAGADTQNAMLVAALGGEA